MLEWAWSQVRFCLEKVLFGKGFVWKSIESLSCLVYIVLTSFEFG